MPAAIVVVETALAITQHEQIRATVVVKITRHYGHRDSIDIFSEIARLRSYINELTSIVTQEPL